MRVQVALAATMIALGTLTGSAGAQLTITPAVGGYIAAGSLTQVQGGAETLVDSRKGTLALGVNLGLGFVRGSAAYATGTTIQDANQNDLGKGNVLAVAADLVLRPLPRILVQPYLLGGIGRKYLSFDNNADNQEVSAIHGGVGADLSLGPIRVMAELTDFVSKDSQGKYKLHDAFLMVGLTLGR